MVDYRVVDTLLVFLAAIGLISNAWFYHRGYRNGRKAIWRLGRGLVLKGRRVA